MAREVIVKVRLTPDTSNSAVIAQVRQQISNGLGNPFAPNAQQLQQFGTQFSQIQQRLQAAQQLLKQRHQQRLEQITTASDARMIAQQLQLANQVTAIQARAQAQQQNIALRHANSLEEIQKQSSVRGLLSSVAGQLGGAAGLAVSGGITGGAVGGLVAAVKAASDLQQLKAQLDAVTGSARETNIQINRLRILAKEPGLGFEEAVTASVRLQAVGFSAEKAERAIKAISNANALSGGTREDFKGILVQLTQASAKSKILAQDLKPILERSPTISKALKDAFGTVDAEQISGKVKGFDQFLEKLLTQLEKLPKAQDTLRNGFDNLKDSATQSLSGLGEPFIGPLTAGLARLTKEIEGSRNELQSLGVTIVGVGGDVQTLGSFLPGFSLKTEIRAINGLLAFTQDLIELLVATALTGIQLVSFGLATAVKKALGFVGIELVGLNEEIKEIEGNLDRLTGRLKQGFANVARVSGEGRTTLDRLFAARDFFRSINPKLKPPPLSPPPVGDGGSGKKSKQLSELEQLTKQLNQLNKEISAFNEQNTKEFALRLQVDDARTLKSELEKILKLRRELKEPLGTPFATSIEGAQAQLTRLEAQKEIGEQLKNRKQIVDPFQFQTPAFLDQFLQLSKQLDELLPKAAQLTAAEKLEADLASGAYGDLAKNLGLVNQLREQAALIDETVRIHSATEAYKSLKEQIEQSIESTEKLTGVQKLQRQIAKIDGLTPEQQAELVGLQAKKDSIDAAKEAEQRGIEAANRVQGFFLSVFRDVGQRGVVAFWDRFKQAGLEAIQRIAAEILTKITLNFASRLFGGQGAAGGQSSGGGLFGGLFGGGGGNSGGSGSGGGLFGGLFGGGGGSGGGIFSTGGFAGGPGAGGILGGGGSAQSGGGGLLGSIGKLFGGSAAGAGTSGVGVTGAGDLSVLTGSVTSGGGLHSLGGILSGGGAAGQGAGLAAGLASTGLIAGGGLLGGLAGGGSPTGKLLGNVGGSLLGASGAAALGLFGAGSPALVALLTNPFTIAIGVALIGVALLLSARQRKVLKDYQRLAQSEYGVNIHDNKVLGQIKQIGQSLYGKEYQKHEIETIRSEQVKQIIAAYAESDGQLGNKKLLLAAQLSDPSNAINQLIRREYGGPVLAGVPYLVGERRPEVFIPNQAGRIAPSVDQIGGIGGTSGNDGALRQMILMLTNQVAILGDQMEAFHQKISSMKPGEVVTVGLKERPGAAANAFRNAQRRDTNFSAGVFRDGGF